MAFCAQLAFGHRPARELVGAGAPVQTPSAVLPQEQEQEQERERRRAGERRLARLRAEVAEAEARLGLSGG